MYLTRKCFIEIKNLLYKSVLEISVLGRTSTANVVLKILTIVIFFLGLNTGTEAKKAKYLIAVIEQTNGFLFYEYG